MIEQELIKALSEKILKNILSDEDFITKNTNALKLKVKKAIERVSVEQLTDTLEHLLARELNDVSICDIWEDMNGGDALNDALYDFFKRIDFTLKPKKKKR